MVRGKLACGVLVGLVATASAGASSDSQKAAYVTFRAPVALPGITLEPGTYVFELATPHRNVNLVRVTDATRSRLIFTALTEEVVRPKGMPDDHLITFHETATGVSLPIDVWYPQGEATGHRFVYPADRHATPKTVKLAAQK